MTEPTPTGSQVEQAESADDFAERLLAAAAKAGSHEGVEAVAVSTQELCRALGKPDGATMEEVKRFACEVVQRMRGHGVTVGCGCGYLSLLVFTDQAMASAHQENRDLCSMPLESFDE